MSSFRLARTAAFIPVLCTFSQRNGVIYKRLSIMYSQGFNPCCRYSSARGCSSLIYFTLFYAKVCSSLFCPLGNFVAYEDCNTIKEFTWYVRERPIGYFNGKNIRHLIGITARSNDVAWFSNSFESRSGSTWTHQLLRDRIFLWILVAWCEEYGRQVTRWNIPTKCKPQVTRLHGAPQFYWAFI
jgi:hypothetical protein